MILSLRTAKVALLSLFLSASAASLIAWYLGRRRRDGEASASNEITAESLLVGDRAGSGCRSRHNGSCRSSGRQKQPPSLRSGSGASRRLRPISPNLTTCSHPDCREEAEPQDQARLGIAALQHVITALETSLDQFDAYSQRNAGPPAVRDEAEDSIIAELRSLLQQAYEIRERAKQSVLTDDDGYCPSTDASLSDSDSDSFVSAAEELDISDLDSQLKQTEAKLYRLALLEIEKEAVVYRKLRTMALGCGSDTEYLARLHCLRLGCDSLVRERQSASWLRIAGKEVGTLLLDRLGYDAQPFELAYDELLEFVSSPEGLENMRRDLEQKGVRVFSVYDVVIDFLLLDAFDVLECPPQSILTVLQNRWLSNSFKRRALDNTIWTLVMAKRKMLGEENGFLYRFYALCAALGPALAWGFLGPEDNCRDVCTTFKERLQRFARSLFDPLLVRFTSVEELSADILVQSRGLLSSLRADLAADS